MNPFMLWLRVRQLRQYLTVATLTGIGGAWIGTTVSPVPGQLFADVAGVPLVYLSPVLLSVSVAQWAPFGTYWFEDRAATARTFATLVTGWLLTSVPPLFASNATEVCLVSARNGLLLCLSVVVVRACTTAAAASMAALIPSFIVWTFGWNESGRPREWALLLTRPESPAGLAAIGLLLALSTATVIRPRLYRP